MTSRELIGFVQNSWTESRQLIENYFFSSEDGPTDGLRTTVSIGYFFEGDPMNEFTTAPTILFLSSSDDNTTDGFARADSLLCSYAEDHSPGDKVSIGVLVVASICLFKTCLSILDLYVKPFLQTEQL